MVTETRLFSRASIALSALFFGALLAMSSGCGVDDHTAAALIAQAVDERGEAIDQGDEPDAGDLFLILYGAGVRDRIATEVDPTACLGSDPRDKDHQRHVDEPLDPTTADDRRDLVSGTSPDPAPEIGGDGSVSDCAEGYAAFEGECLPREIVDGFLALGLDGESSSEEG